MKGTELVGGRYRLDEQIAEGGMGEVWRAHDELLGRDVAVKLLRGALAADPVVSERFRREARAAASLLHPNMANVFDYVEEEARPGIVMELVDGETLADLMARSAPMDPPEVLEIAGQVLGALSAAHAAGVVHRDIKPGNVILDGNGQVKVTDFGIARSIGESTLTETGIVLGSVHYLAPEQLRGGASVPESDLYAVGVMLYEMLTGLKPFTGETPVAIAMSRLEHDPAPLRGHRRGLSPALEAVVMKALARRPDQRFRTAALMHAALRDAVGARNVAATMALPLADADATRAIPRSDHATTRPMVAASPREPHAPKKRLRLLKPVLLVLVVGLAAVGVLAFLVSRPPATVRVPDLAGLPIERAKLDAQEAGLVVAEAGAYSEKSAGTVLRQDPPPNTEVKRGAKVTLVVSRGPKPCCTVPSLIGRTASEAEEALKAAGLKLGDVREEVSTSPEGTVISQEPGAGGSVAPDTEVDIVVAKAEEEKKKRGQGRGD